MIELKKKGESINLTKSGSQRLGEILINLNWNQNSKQTGGFFASLFKGNQNMDLDLGVLYEFKNGDRGCVQALGNSFGSLNQFPYMQLDHDDRTGSSKGGENLSINGNKISEIERILVYTFIYEGAANWSEVDGVITLTHQNGEDIVVKMDEHRNGLTMCAIAMIENVNDQTFNVKKLVEYYQGHHQMDRAYGWGMNWVSGSK